MLVVANTAFNAFAKSLQELEHSANAVSDRGPVTVEDQRRALMISEQQLAQQVDEADRARELERQRALEDAMDRTRDASSWGI